ncbi:MAG: phosphatase PAP2 family protein [Magnetospirillum sp.]|nr:phosphatase PAP2 family protein [Magnetospirillum sp.]
MLSGALGSSWFLVAALAAVDAVWLAASGLGVVPASLAVPSLGVAVLAGMTAVYRRWRPVPAIAALTGVAAETVAFTAVAAILSYLVAAAGGPLADDRLAAADRAVGLDWMAVYAWSKAHPMVEGLLRLAYVSLIPQMIVVQVALNFRGRAERSRELLWLFIATALGCIALSGPFPTAGAFAHFGVALDEPYVRQFLAVRAGTLTAIDLRHAQGIVQFPSLHLGLAVVLTYAARGIPLLFPLLAAINAVVIAATPTIGGHHFADLWGGAVLSAVAVLAVRRASLSRRLGTKRPGRTASGGPA